jgi:hypothetical protein
MDPHHDINGLVGVAASSRFEPPLKHGFNRPLIETVIE